MPTPVLSTSVTPARSKTTFFRFSFSSSARFHSMVFASFPSTIRPFISNTATSGSICFRPIVRIIGLSLLSAPNGFRRRSRFDPIRLQRWMRHFGLLQCELRMYVRNSSLRERILGLSIGPVNATYCRLSVFFPARGMLQPLSVNEIKVGTRALRWYHRACGLLLSWARSTQSEEDHLHAQSNRRPAAGNAGSGCPARRQPALGTNRKEGRHARSRRQGRRHGSGFHTARYQAEPGLPARLPRQEERRSRLLHLRLHRWLNEADAELPAKSAKAGSCRHPSVGCEHGQHLQQCRLGRENRSYLPPPQ